MPDNMSQITYIATHLSAAICSASIKTSSFNVESLNGVAKQAALVYDAVYKTLVEKTHKEGSASLG